jgi:hypothetical protein
MPSQRALAERRPRKISVSEHRLNRAIKAIETERDNLSQAESILGCLKIALEYEPSSSRSPYYPDVAEIARTMLRKSVGALDPANLALTSRNKVREEGLASALPRTSPRVALLSSARIQATRSLSIRLHRRDYSIAARIASRNCASAAANISG